MDKNTALAYRQRWQAVAGLEREEQQNATVAQRWQQLQSLLRFGSYVAAPDLLREIQETDIIAARWRRLKEKYEQSIVGVERVNRRRASVQ